MELQRFGYAPGLGRRRGFVKRRHPVSVHIVENQPDHRNIGVGLTHQLSHPVSEVLHGALPGYRHIAPAPAGFAGEDQVARLCPLVLVVLAPRLPRVGRQRFSDVGQQLGLWVGPPPLRPPFWTG